MNNSLLVLPLLIQDTPIILLPLARHVEAKTFEQIVLRLSQRRLDVTRHKVSTSESLRGAPFREAVVVIPWDVRAVRGVTKYQQSVMEWK